MRTGSDDPAAISRSPAQACLPKEGPFSRTHTLPHSLTPAGEVNSWVRVSRRAANTPARRGTTSRDRSQRGHICPVEWAQRSPCGERKRPPPDHSGASFRDPQFTPCTLKQDPFSTAFGKALAAIHQGQEALPWESSSLVPGGNQEPSVPLHRLTVTIGKACPTGRGKRIPVH